MDLERFGQLVDAYGGNEAAWPDAERDAAQRLLAAEPRARALKRAAQALDGELALFQIAPPPPLDRILALQALGEALRQEPMDRDGASRALAGLRESGSRYQAVLHESLLDLLAELPAERREAAMRAMLRGKGGALLPGTGPHR